MKTLLTLVVAAVLCACGSQPAPTASGPSLLRPSASTAPSLAADAAGADLDHYLELLERTHPEPFHGVARDVFVGHLDEIKARLADRSPEATMVAVMDLVAMLSREDGRDGHQLAIPTDDGPMLPIRIFEFSDGVFITDAVDPTLIGARITEVAGHPVAEVLALLEPLVPRDSPATVPGMIPFFFLRADVLQGLGLITDDASIALTIETTGSTRSATLVTIPVSEYVDWAGDLGLIELPERDGLRFTDRSRSFWTETLDDATLYVRLTMVQPVPIIQLDALRRAIEAPGLTRVIFDLRHNPGGDNGTYPALRSILHDTPLPLWILTDRRTFSAASNLATELEQARDTRFAGEAMGGGLNFWDDVGFVALENLPVPMQIGISTRYWQKSFVDDPRLTIEPDLAVEYVSADYFAGRDGTLEAVLSAP